MGCSEGAPAGQAPADLCPSIRAWMISRAKCYRDESPSLVLNANSVRRILGMLMRTITAGLSTKASVPLPLLGCVLRIVHPGLELLD